MFQISEKDPDTHVHVRAQQRGQETFTIVAQDRTAPSTIAWWILQNIETAPKDKLRDALDRAIRMREHVPRKSAD